MGLGLGSAAAFASTIVLGLAAPAARGVPVPTFSVSPAAPSTGELVTFVSPFDNPQLWDLDGDGVCDDASGASATRTFQVAGTYAVKLCVLSGGATFTRNVVVLNRPPVAGFDYAPAAPFAGDTVLFTSTSSDPDGPIVSSAWDLDGDGAFDDGSGMTASRVFPAAGSYGVRLQVVDRDGASTVATATVSVGVRPPALLSPFPVVRMIATVLHRGTRVRALNVIAPKGARVTVHCHGHGCAFRRLERSARGLVRIRRLRRRLLKPHALIEVRVTDPGTIGKYTRFRVGKGRPPRRSDRCLLPGSARPARCPAS